MIKNIRHFGIPIIDIEKSLNFYCDLLGFKLVHKNNIKDVYGKDLTYIKLKINNDPVLLELLFHDILIYSSSLVNIHMAFTVDDIDATYKKLLDAKVNFLSPPKKAQDSACLLCFCYDPSGNLIELVEEK